ncbi:MAG: AAA family ATPase [Deltaproteobacteria bacterium]|nr:MAG: AAA family ATPase [Deltaproteobacteria bacterium]
MSASDLDALIASRRIVVVVGCGGVGKTTLSAALALHAARSGRRALVLTIDPARRLADALGIGAIGNQPVSLPRDGLRALGVPDAGSLDALMLDMKRTFDDLVERFADSDEARDRILSNAIYQHVSDALAGSAEYAAMEKVYELSERSEYQLIVLDTPPSQHAVDFLEAPTRLLEFLDSRLVQILLHPAFAAGRLGFRVFHRGAHRVLQVLERVSGLAFLEDVSDFLLAFEGMSHGFRERARRVRSFLSGPEAAFLIAAGPARDAAELAMRFFDRLAQSRVPVAGVIANRVRVWPSGGAPPDPIEDAAQRERAESTLARALADAEGSEFPALEAARAAIAASDQYALLVREDARATQRLFDRARDAGGFGRTVPELPLDVHDLEGLARVADALFGESTGETPLVAD